MFSSRRRSFVVPGIGTIHGFLREQPSQGDLSGRGLLPFRDPAYRLDQVPDWPSAPPA